jgi:leucyl/phenylalanyl-tRNA--protein transferase
MTLLGRYGTDELEWKVFSERAIITPDTARIPRSTRRDMNRGEFEVTKNRDFEGVLRGCKRQKWSWITPPLMDVYRGLRALGVAMTLETYRDGQLVGGQLGLMVGDTFAGLSAFHDVGGAGTVLWGAMMEELLSGGFGLVDCGEMKPHFARHGAYVVSRDVFLQRVVQGVIRSR